MNVYVDVGGSEALTLRGALLVCQGKSRSFVAWHEARNPEQGAPFLGEAQPLTKEFVHGLAQGLGSRIPVEVLPENVLVRTAEAVVWWTPAAYRTMSSVRPPTTLRRKTARGSRIRHSCGA